MPAISRPRAVSSGLGLRASGSTKTEDGRQPRGAHLRKDQRLDPRRRRRVLDATKGPMQPDTRVCRIRPVPRPEARSRPCSESSPRSGPPLLAEAGVTSDLVGAVVVCTDAAQWGDAMDVSRGRTRGDHHEVPDDRQRNNRRAGTPPDGNRHPNPPPPLRCSRRWCDAGPERFRRASVAGVDDPSYVVHTENDRELSVAHARASRSSRRAGQAARARPHPASRPHVELVVSRRHGEKEVVLSNPGSRYRPTPCLGRFFGSSRLSQEGSK